MKEDDIKKFEYPGPVKTGEFIRELRIAHNMTQEELGDIVFVTRKAVSKWENGNCYPSLDIFPHLADVFGVTLDELLSGEFKDGYYDENKSINFIIKMAKNRNLIIIKKFLLIISMICLLIFFYENYNATKIYSVYCEDENLQIGRGMIVTTRSQDYINFSYFKADFKDIDEKENVDYELYIKDEEKTINLFKFNIDVTDYFEKNGYKELTNVNVKDKYDKMYIRIEYFNKKGNKVTKNIPLKVKLNYQSNDIYNFKTIKPTTLLNENNKISFYDKDERVETYGDNKNLAIDLSFLYNMSERELKEKFDNKTFKTKNEKIWVNYDDCTICFKSTTQQDITIKIQSNQIYFINNNNTVLLKILNKKIIFTNKEKNFYNQLKKVIDIFKFSNL